MTPNDPFKIPGPALISFSGGRTSAYMLWRILRAHNGKLPDDVLVTFANTGKEMPQTLYFVNECSERWGVPIVWLEWEDNGHWEKDWRVVSYLEADQLGTPFKNLIDKKQELPGPRARFCTMMLKVNVIHGYARTRLGWREFDMVLGLRADEPRRVSNMKNNRQIYDVVMPLATAGITKRDVQVFWDRQNFDLRLPNVGGRTAFGNCDLCFLKTAANIRTIIEADPTRAKWWIDRETEAAVVADKAHKARFRSDRPSYAAMLDAVQRQQNFDFGDRDEIIDCFCGDGA